MSLFDPIPWIFVYNVTKEFVYELDYERGSSFISSYAKKDIWYDKASDFLYAFSEVEPLYFDYLDLNTKPLRWNSY